MFYAIPVNLRWGEAFKVRKMEDEEKLKSFLRNTRPNDYMIIEGQEVKAVKSEVINIVRP